MASFTSSDNDALDLLLGVQVTKWKLGTYNQLHKYLIFYAIAGE